MGCNALSNNENTIPLVYFNPRNEQEWAISFTSECTQEYFSWFRSLPNEELKDIVKQRKAEFELKRKLEDYGKNPISDILY